MRKEDNTCVFRSWVNFLMEFFAGLKGGRAKKMPAKHRYEALEGIICGLNRARFGELVDI
jgi:hypothetical protein